MKVSVFADRSAVVAAAALCLGGLLAPDSAIAATYRIATEDCQKLVPHVPRGDVAYQPGVDVRGKAVAAADIGGNQGVRIPEAIDIEIGIDLADRFGRQGTSGERALLPFSGKATLGTITVKGDEAFWNGEKIGPSDQAVIADSCRKNIEVGVTSIPVSKPNPK